MRQIQWNPDTWEPQLSVLTLKSKDPCIKSQFHLVFLGKGSRGSGMGECPCTRSTDTLANNWPWRPQPEPAELKCVKALQHGPWELPSSPCQGHPYSCLGEKKRRLLQFFSHFSPLWIQLLRDGPSLPWVKRPFLLKWPLLNMTPNFCSFSQEILSK